MARVMQSLGGSLLNLMEQARHVLIKLRTKFGHCLDVGLTRLFLLLPLSGCSLDLRLEEPRNFFLPFANHMDPPSFDRQSWPPDAAVPCGAERLEISILNLFAVVCGL